MVNVCHGVIGYSEMSRSYHPGLPRSQTSGLHGNALCSPPALAAQRDQVRDVFTTVIHLPYSGITPTVFSVWVFSPQLTCAS